MSSSTESMEKTGVKVSYFEKPDEFPKMIEKLSQVEERATREHRRVYDALRDTFILHILSPQQHVQKPSGRVGSANATTMQKSAAKRVRKGAMAVSEALKEIIVGLKKEIEESGGGEGEFDKGKVEREVVLGKRANSAVVQGNAKILKQATSDGKQQQALTPKELSQKPSEIALQPTPQVGQNMKSSVDRKGDPRQSLTPSKKSSENKDSTMQAMQPTGSAEHARSSGLLLQRSQSENQRPTGTQEIVAPSQKSQHVQRQPVIPAVPNATTARAAPATQGHAAGTQFTSVEKTQMQARRQQGPQQPVVGSVQMTQRTQRPPATQPQRRSFAFTSHSSGFARTPASAVQTPTGGPAPPPQVGPANLGTPSGVVKPTQPPYLYKTAGPDPLDAEADQAAARAMKAAMESVRRNTEDAQKSVKEVQATKKPEQSEVTRVPPAPTSGIAWQIQNQSTSAPPSISQRQTPTAQITGLTGDQRTIPMSAQEGWQATAPVQPAQTTGPQAISASNVVQGPSPDIPSRRCCNLPEKEHPTWWCPVEAAKERQKIIDQQRALVAKRQNGPR